MKTLTATEALREAYAGGAVDDNQAKALAEMLLMVKNRDDEATARRAVAAAFKERFAVSGGRVMGEAPERIRAWIWDLPYPSKHNGKAEWNSTMFPADQASTEYIRADLVPQLQPIETAPKDGTKLILLCGDTCGVFAPCEWSKAGEISEDGFWLWWQAEPDILTEIRRPTHWMLPLKPEAV